MQAEASKDDGSSRSQPSAGHEGPTLFGPGLDRLARADGDWPLNVTAHSVHVLNGRRELSPADRRVVVIGSEVMGADAKGFPVFRDGDADYFAVVTLAQYREALASGEA